MAELNDNEDTEDEASGPSPSDSPTLSEQAEDATIGHDVVEGDDEDFSLDQLSAAYAQVLREQNQSETTATEDSATSEFPATESHLSSNEGESDSGERSLDASIATAKSRVFDSSDDDACAISPQSILEAVLFVGGPKEVKLTSRKIAALMRDVSPKEITALVKQLNESYSSENSAYRIVTDKQAIRMELHPDLIPVQNHMLGRNRATRLTQQAIDVLAIVAYNQPVTREQVDKVRGKPSSSILNQMVKRDLLFVDGDPSNPRVKPYRTTDRFLDLFGLDTVDDLPQSHDVSDIEELAD